MEGRRLKLPLCQWIMPPNQEWKSLINHKRGIVLVQEEDYMQYFRIEKVGCQVIEATQISTLAMQPGDKIWLLVVAVTIVHHLPNSICLTSCASSQQAPAQTPSHASFEEYINCLEEFMRQLL